MTLPHRKKSLGSGHSRLPRHLQAPRKLAPVYETVRQLTRALPPEVAPIDYAGAPWTIATYMARLFERWCVKPVVAIITALKDEHPDVPVIAFPRGAGLAYDGFAEAVGAHVVSAVAAARVVLA